MYVPDPLFIAESIIERDGAKTVSPALTFNVTSGKSKGSFSRSTTAGVAGVVVVVVLAAGVVVTGAVVLLLQATKATLTNPTESSGSNFLFIFEGGKINNTLIFSLN